MSNPSDYKPIANSKPAKVIQFFSANPDEELTADDMVIKFGMQRNSVHTILRPATMAGLLSRRRDEFGDHFYSLGPSLIRETSEPTEAASSADNPLDPVHSISFQWPTNGRSIDIEAINLLVVDSHIPYTPLPSQHKWDPLFSKLDQAGQSVAFPAEWHFGVAVSAGNRNRGAKDCVWKVAKVSRTQSRLWRLQK